MLLYTENMKIYLHEYILCKSKHMYFMFEGDRSRTNLASNDGMHVH